MVKKVASSNINSNSYWDVTWNNGQTQMLLQIQCLQVPKTVVSETPVSEYQNWKAENEQGP